MDRTREQLHLDDRGFEDVRVVDLEDAGRWFGLSWADRLLENHHRYDVIGIVAFVVAIGACRWVNGVVGQVTIVAMTYSFGMFVILIGRGYGNKSAAASTDDSGTASESPRETRKLERTDGPKFVRSDPPSPSDLRPALDRVEEGKLGDHSQR